ncbi:MAG: LL-diaminopimelate aminotransferase [Ruminococcaceae bacterium]|nr:LL-diaminopimelate aminotransferase [Oscillospiraceae bacterium]
MIKLNSNFLKLPGSYLFAEIAKRSSEYAALHPENELIKLGIGDVTLPLPNACIKAACAAAEEMGNSESFKGYGPYDGYEFLRKAIAENEYSKIGAAITADEIFVSDGAKSDCANIGDIFSDDSIVAVCDPVYPVYVDANAMAGRAGNWDGDKWSNIIYMPCVPENGFVPQIPDRIPDIIYLCYPNNPTGTVATRDDLKLWVDFANEHGSIIIYDSAYRAFITDPELPRSIYEIPGAKTCAIELGSFSKTAGFTGMRCGWTAIPRELKRDGVSLYDVWMRRQATKYNGTSYVVQCAAAAIYTKEGKEQVKRNIEYYLNNAKTLREGLGNAGFEVFGGENSPYVWFRAPGKSDSWEFFDELLKNANVITTPGSGFGPSGEGFIRVTAFGDAEKTKEAVNRILALF